MEKYWNSLRGIGLQFFAEAGGESAGGAESSGTDTGSGGDASGDAGGGDSAEKTFTQAEVNKMLAREKRQGRSSALADLGLDPADKDAVTKAKAILDSQKSDAEKAAEQLRAAGTKQAEAEARAEAAERKLAALAAGCRADMVEEVAALAAAKVTKDTDFEAALEALKKKMPSLFGAEDGDQGTGGGQGHRRGQSKDQPGSLGKRLAEKSRSSIKNPYFSN